jgi:hypothetical protein
MRKSTRTYFIGHEAKPTRDQKKLFIINSLLETYYY